MIALLLSYLLIAYVVVPGVLFRRFFSYIVPLRKFQWSRTEEITSSVISMVLPLVGAFLLVRHTRWFASHPFHLTGTEAGWNDWKNIVSGSHSEKFFDEHREEVWKSVGRTLTEQGQFLTWFYVATIVEAVGSSVLTYYYGGLRKVRWLGTFLGKFVIPSVSEWYAMFTAFTFPRSPKRKVMVDLLTTDGLYQGEIADYHVDRDGRLTGMLMEQARRFDRVEYLDDKQNEKRRPLDEYWRKISGDSLYFLAEKISNINLTYLPEERLDELAEKNLKKLNIEARVAVEPTPPRLSESQTTPSEQGAKNFTICGHCLAKGSPGRVPRLTSETPLVSRSDGKTYHLFLLFGPNLQPDSAKRAGEKTYIAHYIYSLDTASLRDEPVSVVIPVHSKSELNLNECAQSIADDLTRDLAAGKPLSRFYVYQDRKLKKLPPVPK